MDYTEEEKQAMRNEVVELCDAVTEKYDWDANFQRYLEKNW